MKHVRLTLTTLCTSAAVTLFAEGQAHACYWSKICVKFPVTASDLAVGDLPADEDLIFVPGTTGANYPARGVRMTFIPPPPEPPRAVLLDEEGCFAFKADHASGFMLLVYPEAYLGEEQNIRVRAFKSFADMSNNTLPPPWLVHLNGIAPGDSVDVDQFPGANFMSFFALTLETIHRMEILATPQLSGQHTLRIYTDTVANASAEGDQAAHLGGYGTSTTIYLSDELVKKKFVIAHEVGHWLASQWDQYYFSNVKGSNLPPDAQGPFSYAPQAPACKFIAIGSNSSHGIRSAEYGFGAFVEGMAHFVAVKTFDDASTPDAIFKYYKTIDITHPDGAAYKKFVKEDQYLVSMLGGTDSNTLGGRSAWVQHMCEPDWAQTFEVSSEIDWMRLLWQYLELDEVGGITMAKPGLWHVFRQMQLAPTSDHAGWSQAISDPNNVDISPFKTRFDALVLENGVNNLE